VFIGLLQMPVYGLLPVQIHVLMVTAALALRDVTRPSPERPSPERPSPERQSPDLPRPLEARV
jgi:hypothetical protein